MIRYDSAQIGNGNHFHRLLIVTVLPHFVNKVTKIKVVRHQRQSYVDSRQDFPIHVKRNLIKTERGNSQSRPTLEVNLKKNIYTFYSGHTTRHSF